MHKKNKLVSLLCAILTAFALAPAALADVIEVPLPPPESPKTYSAVWVLIAAVLIVAAALIVIAAVRKKSKRK